MGFRDAVQPHVRKGAEPLDVNGLDPFQHRVVFPFAHFGTASGMASSRRFS